MIFDLVLCDIKMPKWDAWLEVLEACLRKNKNLKSSYHAFSEHGDLDNGRLIP